MLTQLTTLKARLKLPEHDVQDDVLLTSFITAVSARLDRECNRIFARAEDATYEFRADEMDIFVDRYPVEVVNKWFLKDDETTGWVEQTDIVYLLVPPKNIIELSIPLGTSRQMAKVEFDGGYVLPGGTVGTGMTALPADVEQACLDQCVWLYQNKDRLGLANVSGEGGSLAKDATLNSSNLLPSVRAMVKKYERWRP